MKQRLLKFGLIMVICNSLSSDGIKVPDLKGWMDVEPLDDMRITGCDWVTHHVDNIQQCLRLCWLFKSCHSLTYSSGDSQCALHRSSEQNISSYMVPDSSSAVVRMSTAALTKPGPELRGCDTRPCDEYQMCSPVRREGSYTCIQMFTAQCQEPPSPPTHATATSDGFRMMTYNCEDGYVPSGSRSVSTCDRSTGRWSTIDLVCEFIDCKNPPSVSGAVASSTDNTQYKAEVTYACYDGAVSPSTSMTVSCQATGDWTSPPEPCRIVSCGNPVSTESTQIVVLSRSTTNPYPGLTEDELARAYGGQANHTCKTGYETTGSSSFISECLANGSWAIPRIFSCEVVDCGPPPTMANASVTTNGTVYRSTASYICDTGYETDQSPLQISCGEDGKWTNVSAVCQPVDCGRPTPVDHAEMDYTSTTLGSVVSDTCKQLIVTVSETNSSRVCEENGNWSVSNLTCVFVPCGAPPDVDHATVVVRTIPDAFVAVYTCNEGYRTGRLYQQCLKGTDRWTSNNVECNIVNCREPPSVQYATFQVTGLTYMSTVTYTCDTGFKLDTDNNNRTCLGKGTWSVEDVECVGITCPQLPEVENAYASNITNGINYGSVVSYECTNETVLVTPTSNITCLSDGWETTSIRCEAVPCGDPPSVAKSTREIIYDSTRQVMQAVYTCEVGHILKTEGVNARTCEAYLWSDEDIVCELVDCGPPPEVANAIVDLNSTTGNDTVYQSLTEYTCNYPYFPVGTTNVVTCQANGHWSELNVTCQKCDDSPQITNGSLEVHGGFDLRTEVTATYKCDQSFLLLGSAQLVCEADGANPPQWKNIEDNKCVQVHWEKPKVTFYGQIYQEAIKNSLLACATGYYLGGDRVVITIEETQHTTPRITGFKAAFWMARLAVPPEHVYILSQGGAGHVTHENIPFVLAETKEYTLCIRMDPIAQTYTLLVDGKKITNLPFQKDIDHEKMKYFMVKHSFNISEVTITYT